MRDFYLRFEVWVYAKGLLGYFAVVVRVDQ